MKVDETQGAAFSVLSVVSMLLVATLAARLSTGVTSTRLPVAPGNSVDRQAQHPQQWSLEVAIMTNKSLIAGPATSAPLRGRRRARA